MLLHGPAAEPVSLVEMKAHLKLDGMEEDGLLGALIAAARVAVETEIRRVLISQNWRAIVERWPRLGVVLPVAPARSVEAVRAIDWTGAATVLDAENYEFDAIDFSVRLAAPVPGAMRYEIDFTAGFGASGIDVPQPLRQALLLLATHWYEHRSAVVMGESPSANPEGWRALVAPWRRMALC
jgi:uncharacterized phiE125 gp8 family phage protein